MIAGGSSEDLGAPGGATVRKHRVGTRGGAGRERLEASGTEEVREAEGTEVDGPEDRHVTAEVRGRARSLRFPVLELPPALVPGAEGIHDVEDDAPVRGVAPARERSADVD